MPIDNLDGGAELLRAVDNFRDCCLSRPHLYRTSTLQLHVTMAPGSTQDGLSALVDLASSTQHLITQLLTALSPTNAHDATTPPSANAPNPLHVLRDSATLLKAHTTKLSLLLINKPFTPSAVAKIIKDVASTCLPAMTSAVDICLPDTWSVLLRQEAQARVRVVMREMQAFLNEVTDLAQAEQGPNQSKQKQSTQARTRDSLTSTGVVWDACDAVIALEVLGIGGLAVKKAEQYRDMIKDAIEELKEWAEGDDDDDDDDDYAASDDESDSIDNLFAAANKLPADRADLRAQLDTSLDKLKKIGMLYTALAKRRLKPFTSAVAASTPNIKVLDELLDKLKQLPEQVDDLASAFYDLDTEQIATQLSACLETARTAAALVKQDWNGKEDEFTAWCAKWNQAMQ